MLSPVINGGITYSPDTTAPFDFGNTATYSCSDGFSLEGSLTRTCGRAGSGVIGMWSGTAPICTGTYTV